jgi:hypothetical protein
VRLGLVPGNEPGKGVTALKRRVRVHAPTGGVIITALGVAVTTTDKFTALQSNLFC